MLHSRHKLAKPSFMVSAASVKEGSNLQIAATGPNFRSEPGASPPPAWFLPGPIRIRAYSARDFSSVWPFHRGIHPEATCAGSAEISTHFHGLAQPALRERWIPVGIHGIHPEESRDRGSHSRKPPSPRRPEGIDSTSKNRLTKLPPLTYPLIIEELRPEETLAGVSFS